MEEKVAQLEAQAQTASALVAPDSLERQFAALEGDSGVEGELRVLKRSQQQQQQQGQRGAWRREGRGWDPGREGWGEEISLQGRDPREVNQGVGEEGAVLLSYRDTSRGGLVVVQWWFSGG